MLLLVIVVGLTCTFTVGLDPAQQALEYVFQLSGSNCGAGTGEVLSLQFDVTAWNQYTDPAIRTANLLSKILERNGGTLDSLSDEFFFLMVRNNVHGDSIIFGSAIALEIGVYSKYNIFCPYAYKKNNTVRSHDISINYDYLLPTTEWYNSVKIKTWENITLATDGIMYRLDNALLAEVEEIYPIAVLADGHWTNPYYDCGGGDIWMVTYSSPIFKRQGASYIFQGVATIDIELTYIDINQCDSDSGSSSTGLDVFRGTHRCQLTTTCVPVTGRGFVPGAYLCSCLDGYYFPDKTASINAYTGEQIDEHFRQMGFIQDGKFRCAACATGCDTCNDDSPCLYQRNEALVITLLFFTVLTMFGFTGIAIITFLYRRETVIRSASPIFLEIMCLGGILICCEFFAMYSEATPEVCIVRIWPIHLGFFVLYGSLILKTWRISVIFSVGTQKRVRLPDQVLLQRFGLMVVLVMAVLAAWTGSKPPTVDTLKTSNDLKFYVCDFGFWEYALLGVETLFLLYGVYLCFTVRKAPAHFNESRHITWAVYNAIILGSFMALMLRLVVTVIGPDFMLILLFAQIQVYSTVTILLIFIPKFQALIKKIDIEPNPALTTHNTIQTITGRLKKTQIAPLPAIRKQNAFTQTEITME